MASLETSDQRRRALLIPIFFPSTLNLDNTKDLKMYVEKFTNAIGDAVFLRKRQAPHMIVEISLFRSQEKCKEVHKIMLETLKSQRGLDQNIHIVTYPFEGSELRPLEFLHSLPLFNAIPFDPSVADSTSSIKAVMSQCILAVPLYELLTTPFYQSTEEGPREVHPVMSSLAINLKSLFKEYDGNNSDTQQSTGTDKSLHAKKTLEDALGTVAVKGGHRKAKIFIIPFAWRAAGSGANTSSNTKLASKPTLSTCIKGLPQLFEKVIQKYVDELNGLS